MGSSGKVVNLVVGKEVTSITGQFQKGYIGTPTAKLSLTLEEGSKLSSVGNDAFKDNTFFVSIDLSNAGNVTFGTSAFNNMTNLTHMSSNSGKATLQASTFANLNKLEELAWNASTTTLGWSPANITTTRTLAASSNLTGTTSGQSGTASVSASTGNAYAWNSLTYKYLTGVTYTASDQTASQIAGTTTLSYTFAGENTGSHPFYKLGSSTAKGTRVVFSNTVQSIPSYMFTSGIQMVETNASTQSINPANVTAASKAITLNNSRIKSQGGNLKYIYHYYYNSSGSWVWSTASQSLKTGTTTVPSKLSYTVTDGTKQSYATGIKIASLNSVSKNLTSVGSNIIGSINYDLNTTTSKVTVPTTTAAVASGSANVVATGLISTNSTMNGSSYAYIGFRHDSDSSYTSGSTTCYAYAIAGSSASNYNWNYGNVNCGSFSHSSNWRYYGYYGFPSAATATAGVKQLTGSAPTVNTLTYTVTGSTTQTTKDESVAASTMSTASYTDASLMNNGSTIINLGIMGANATVNQYAFAGESSASKVYLAATINTANTNSFYTRVGAGNMYLYGRDASSAFASQAGIATNNSYTKNWLPGAKDLGLYVAHYQVGDAVTAYLFEQIDGTYIINLVGSGATYDTYTASNRPGWAAYYATKVTQLIVDDTVTSVGPYLFYGHTALTSVQFGTGLTSIGAHAFGNCTGLDTFTVPATLTSVGERILEGAAVKTVYYNANTEDAYHSMSGCDANEIILGANVTKIGDGTLGDISTFFVEAGEALK